MASGKAKKIAKKAAGSKPAPKKKSAKTTAVGKKGAKTAAASKKRGAPPAKERLKVKAIDVKFSLHQKIQRQKEVAWRMIDGEAVIITPADSTMHSLNDVGTRIWELITGNRTLREVADVIQTEFDVEADRAQKDTIWFAECLAKKGLVESL